MTGIAPRQRAAIAVSFGVQAVLIAAALALPAQLSSTVSASSSAPAPAQLLPLVTSLGTGATSGTDPVTVTVKIGAESTSETFPVPGSPSLFLLERGSPLTATVTLTVPADASAAGISFALADHSRMRGSRVSIAAGAQNLLSAPYPTSAGTSMYLLPLDGLAPRSDMVIVMTVTDRYDADMASGVIAEIATR